MGTDKFDARKEMLNRPNEWVAAFKAGDRFLKVGFRTDLMYPVTTWRWEMPIEECVPQAFKYDIDRCIPIEDVPKEETYTSPDFIDQ